VEEAVLASAGAGVCAGAASVVVDWVPVPAPFVEAQPPVTSNPAKRMEKPMSVLLKRIDNSLES
jgi:hypothetical protein